MRKKINETLNADLKIQEFTTILSLFADAASFSSTTKSWIQLENIVKAVWNSFYELIINPFEMTTTDGWIHITLIAE